MEFPTWPYHCDDIGELTDLPPIFRDQIEHFFRHFKDLERGKWDPAETLPFALGKIVELLPASFPARCVSFASSPGGPPALCPPRPE